MSVDLPPRAALDALLLDAGNTLVFLDMSAVAEVARAEGVAVEATKLQSVEGEAKRRYQEALTRGVAHEAGWGLYLSSLLEAVGVDASTAVGLVPALRRAHDELNLWRRVPDGLLDALSRARGAGLRVGVVSNSEGRLPELFRHVGLEGYFELIVDSSLEGVQKPDPAIFHRALERLHLPAERALYVGDLPDVDVLGARRAGLAAALVDPFGFYPEVAPRFPSVAALVDALLEG